MNHIKAGSVIVMRERIVAIELRTVPKKPGWVEEYAALVLVDAGDKGHWIPLTDSQWAEFQANLENQ